jgi:hypothetical protein
MKQRASASLLISTALMAAVLVPAPALAQHRGQYLPGLFGVASGTMPEPGLTYANIFYYTPSDRAKGPDGVPLPVSGQFAIMVDNNIFVYVTKFKLLGANIGFQTDLPLANGSLTALLFPAVSGGLPVNGGGGGFGDSYFAPFVLGWHIPRADLQAGYAFFAPTGRFVPGASNNIGAGFWTNTAFGGATAYLTKNKALTVNAFSIYEWHTRQEGTNVTPGETESLDYSILQMIPLTKKETALLQVGAMGYGQWQATRNEGQGPILSATQYGVDAIGFTANVVLPQRKLSVGTRYLWEYDARNTREGRTLMMTAGVTF